MNRIRRGPWGVLLHEVNTMQDEVSRLFNRVTHVPTTPHAPPLNVWEDDQAIHIEADLAGVDPANIEVTVTEGNHLAIRGERFAPDIAGGTWVRQERGSGPFLREIGLPALVDSEKVEARYEAGVLKLTLPKHEAVKPRKIQVKVGV